MYFWVDIVCVQNQFLNIRIRTCFHNIDKYNSFTKPSSLNFTVCLWLTPHISVATFFFHLELNTDHTTKCRTHSKSNLFIGIARALN